MNAPKGQVCVILTPNTARGKIKKDLSEIAFQTGL